MFFSDNYWDIGLENFYLRGNFQFIIGYLFKLFLGLKDINVLKFEIFVMLGKYFNGKGNIQKSFIIKRKLYRILLRGECKEEI